VGTPWLGRVESTGAWAGRVARVVAATPSDASFPAAPLGTGRATVAGCARGTGEDFTICSE
jgi:hypothetical protein